MPSMISVACPECHKEMKAPATLLGKSIRCKHCGHTFALGGGAPAAKGKGAPPPKGKGAKGAKPPPAKARSDDEEEDSNPYGVTSVDLTPRCPNCANELESEDAVICLHCGYNTRTRTRVTTRKVADVTGGQIFLWLLPGILCALAFVLLFTVDTIFVIKIKDWVDPDIWYQSMWNSLFVKMWLWIISAFVMWYLVKFAVKRLILHPKPPEVEL